MGLTLQNMRDNVRTTLGVDDTDWLDPVVDSWINKSYWELDSKFPFREKEANSCFNTVIGTYVYTIGASNFESLQNLSVFDPSTEQQRSIDRTTIDWMNQQYSIVDSMRGIPTSYVRREQKDLIFWPTPDAIYNISYEYLKILPDLVTGSSNPAFPRQWHEIVELGAEWRGFKAIGDTKRMIDSRNAQVTMIGSSVPVEAKEEFDSHRAGVQVIGRSYDGYDTYTGYREDSRGRRVN